MTSEKPEERLRQLLPLLGNKRARIVIEHILQQGYISTEELQKNYGYNHPPRAARDVRELGIPLETFRVRSSEGRIIAAYRFGDLSTLHFGRLLGRRNVPRSLKAELYRAAQGKCGICNGEFELRHLQVDHRVPYEVVRESEILTWNAEDYMLLCGACNRAKSWCCEHCHNRLKDKQPHLCQSCYWASPGSYTHIALREIRRADIVWEGEEIPFYDKLKRAADTSGRTVPAYIKQLIAKLLDEA
ncbi:MAG TPA: HNH endonuclease signature motif containing protein [Chthonomonas sp.]|uniref:HNH endonuclease n=1 Tax=Chthonomonas sp. TaxID=2282153 RepID=UPI002B4B2F3D|nr:HNH endonuclease signature motif containing protein [Chthonomonas sp.]HLI48176.1 HNH endonuclease signature motif containing protein [Chthonomonas sp.]